MINLPNTITFLRILLVPVFLYLFWSAGPNRLEMGMAVFAAAGLTDILDGYLARRYNLITSLGKVLDPIADKMMIIAAMTSLYFIGKIPLWFLLLVLSKDLLLVVGSFFMVVKQRTEVSASIYGKLATVFVYSALFASAFQIKGSGVIAIIAGVVSVVALISYVNNYAKHRI